VHWEADEGTQRLTLWVTQTVTEPYYICSGCGMSTRSVRDWKERRVRDLPWAPWQVWLVVEVHRVVCPDFDTTRTQKRGPSVRQG